ncbi:MAG: diheme cytochrome c-553 [Bacteroidia bacterium]
MKTYLLLTSLILLSLIFTQCTSVSTERETLTNVAEDKYHGYKNQIEWGEHLVVVAGCNDCHTPKKMTAQGPVLDSALWLSGHPAEMPYPDVDRIEMEKKGYAVTGTLTSWVGPWGVSFAGNLTSDATGIGNWQEENFFTAIREGKFKGIKSARSLLPPMPWDMYMHFTDDELKAIFAYLKSTKPVNNIVPAPIPPASAMAEK